MTERFLRLIKRYANRKLYDTRASHYVTLDQIAEMIQKGEEVKVVDNNSKDDLTSVTLAQIIFEKEKRQRSFLPLSALRLIIQSGGHLPPELMGQPSLLEERMRRTLCHDVSTEKQTHGHHVEENTADRKSRRSGSTSNDQ